MQSRAIAVCMVVMIQAWGARAGECVVNANPVSPATLASELQVGFGGVPGQLGGVPFSVVSYEGLNVLWTDCGEDCLSLTYEGDTQCGNLVASPIDSSASLELVDLAAETPVFTEVVAQQELNGKWNVFAQAFLNPSWEVPHGSANFNFELGTREVFDVGGSGGTQPLDIRLRVGSNLEIARCVGDLYHSLPGHDARFRVTERTTGTTLLDTVYYDNFFVIDDTFSIDASPGLVLQVDVWFGAGGGASKQFTQDEFGNQCSGGYAILDFAETPADDGIQLFFSPAASHTLTPRSGIVYATPEPDAFAAALVAVALLAARKRLT